MLCVDVRGHPAEALRLRHHVEGDSGLPGSLRAEHLRHATLRDPADAEGQIEESEPVDIAGARTSGCESPRRITAPSPN